MDSSSWAERLRGMSDDALLQMLGDDPGKYPTSAFEGAKSEAEARGLLCKLGDTAFKVVVGGSQPTGPLNAAQVKAMFLRGDVNDNSLVYVQSKGRWLFLSAVFDSSFWKKGSVTPPKKLVHKVKPEVAEANAPTLRVRPTPPTAAQEATTVVEAPHEAPTVASGRATPRADSPTASDAASNEARRRAEEHERELAALRRQIEEEERRRREAEQAARLAEEEARRRAEEESRLRAEESRLRAEAEVRRRAEEERLRAAEEARRRAEEEARRIEEEARRIEEEARRIEEEREQRERELAALRKKVEEEAQRRREAEEAARLAEESKRRAEAEARQRAEEARRLAEEEARRLEQEKAYQSTEEQARGRAAEEARRRAEADARRRAEEEARLRAEEDARRRAEEDARHRAEEVARRRAEDDARRRAQMEERRDEEARLIAEAEARRRAEEVAEPAVASASVERGEQFAVEEVARAQAFAPDDAAAEAVADWRTTRPGLPRDGDAAEDIWAEAREPEPQVADAVPTFGGLGQSQSKLPMPVVWGAAGGVALLLIVGLMLFIFIPRKAEPPVADGSAEQTAQPAAKADKGDMVEVAGGTFMMGRNDISESSKSYNQYPAHTVTVGTFLIDRNEVTNAEYADFVRETKHDPPPNWKGGRPAAGNERLPATNVSLDDAQKFAEWRSRRDGVTYRLPTEEEWELAARGTDPARRYPWGADWSDGRANVDSPALKPVGSFPQGASPQGALDLIGNAWEWTSSPASIYKGNSSFKTPPSDNYIVRGGSYQSSSRGDEAITATFRKWVPKDTRHQTLGFRLARDGK